MTVTRTINYEGGAPQVNALVQVLREHHVEVEWDPGEERRDTGVLEIVSLAVSVVGALPAIQAGVADFRKRFPRAKAEIEDDDSDEDEDE